MLPIKLYVFVTYVETSIMTIITQQRNNHHHDTIYKSIDLIIVTLTVYFCGKLSNNECYGDSDIMLRKIN